MSQSAGRKANGARRSCAACIAGYSCGQGRGDAMARCTIATVVVLAAAFRATVGGPAEAQTDIGAAVIAERQVAGSVNGQVRTVAVGSDVFADEVIRAGRDSAARLVFLDETQLMMTANAVVT